MDECKPMSGRAVARATEKRQAVRNAYAVRR